jgi:phosphoribosyl-ATP pyrophosphohydrolase
VMAGAGESAERLKEEAADLLYHLLVLLESREVAVADVLAVLEARMGTSGLKEKAERGKR